MAMAKHAGWWDSLKTFLTEYGKPTVPKRTRPGQPVAPAPAPTPQTQLGPQDLNSKMQAIAQAAKSNTLLFIQYNGNWRYIEPYSYRFKKGGQLLYAYCHKDQHIESFYPSRIQDLQPTKIPYKPRWPVEIGME